MRIGMVNRLQYLEAQLLHSILSIITLHINITSVIVHEQLYHRRTTNVVCVSNLPDSPQL